MIEGVNIPGMGQPIPVDSSSLPEGWEKRVYQWCIGITKGKWDVFITNPEIGKSFRSKTELQKHLYENELPYTSDAFDFSLDNTLKRLLMPDLEKLQSQTVSKQPQGYRQYQLKACAG